MHTHYFIELVICAIFIYYGPAVTKNSKFIQLKSLKELEAECWVEEKLANASPKRLIREKLSQNNNSLPKKI